MKNKKIKILVSVIFIFCIVFCVLIFRRKTSSQIVYISIEGPDSCFTGDEVIFRAVGFDRNLKKIEKDFYPIWKISEKNINLGKFVPSVGKKVIFKANLAGKCHFIVKNSELKKAGVIKISPGPSFTKR